MWMREFIFLYFFLVSKQFTERPQTGQYSDGCEDVEDNGILHVHIDVTGFYYKSHNALLSFLAALAMPLRSSTPRDFLRPILLISVSTCQ